MGWLKEGTNLHFGQNSDFSEMDSKYLYNHIQITFVTITKINLCLNCAFNEDVFLQKYVFFQIFQK